MIKRNQDRLLLVASLLTISLCLGVTSAQQPEAAVPPTSEAASGGASIPSNSDVQTPQSGAVETQKAAETKDGVDEPGKATLPPGDIPKPTKTATENAILKIFYLDKADAEDSARLLKSLHCDSNSNINVDKRTNSLIVESTDENQLRKIEAILLRLDETPTRAKSASVNRQDSRTDSSKPLYGSSQGTIEIRDNPEVRKLVDELSQLNAKATEFAEQIRIRSKEEGSEPSQLEQIRRGLNETLTIAIGIKFTLEQLQLDSLEERIARLKLQIARRTASVKQIVERRARELTEDDSSRWSPDELALSQNSTTKVVETSPSVIHAPAETTASFGRGGRGRQVPRSGQELQAENEDDSVRPSTTQTSISSYPDLAAKLSTMNSDVAHANEQLELTRTLFGNARVPFTEVLKSSNRVDDAIRNRKMIQAEFSATMSDLELQIEAAKSEVTFAQVAYDRLAKSGVVSQRAKTDAERVLMQAKHALERLENRFLLYKKASETNESTSEDARSATPELVEILVAKTDIVPGVFLNDSNVGFVAWPKMHVPEGAITSKEQYTEHSLKIHATRNMPILLPYLNPKGQFGNSSMIPKGMVLVTLPVDSTQTHHGLLKVGADVSVSCVIRRPGSNGQGDMFSIKTVLKRVKVIAVGEKVAFNDSTKMIADAGTFENISLLAHPRQAKLMQLASDVSKAKLRFAMLGDDDKSEEDNRDLTEEELDVASKELIAAGQPRLQLASPKDGPVYLPFDRLVVNLNEPMLTKFLSIEISVQPDAKYAEEVKTALDAAKPVLKTWLTAHLSEKSIEDVRGKVGVNRLREEIKAEFNSRLLFKEGQGIQDILFEEFHVQ